MLSATQNEMLTRVDRGTPMGTLLRRFWVPFLLAEELPEPDCPPVRVQLLGEKLVAFRDTRGRIGLIPEACPHRRVSLFFGRNEEYGLRCVYHGWKFDVEGNCVDMPSEPEASNFKHKVKTTAYPCSEAGGVVWAYLGPRDLTPELPGFEWLDVSRDYRRVIKRIQHTNWVQALEGGIDSSHSNFLHTTLDTFRRTDEWLERAKSSSKLRDKYHALDRSPRFYVDDTDYGLLIGAQRDAEPDTYYWRITHWLMPFYNLFGRGEGGRVNPANGIIWIPINNESCFVFYLAWRTDKPLTPEDHNRTEQFMGPSASDSFLPAGSSSNDYRINRKDQRTISFTGIPYAQWQDLAVQESMGTVCDRTQEHLGVSDSAIIRMRKALLRAAINVLEGVEPHPATHPDVYSIRAGEAVLPRAEGFDPLALEALCR